ncbi:adenosinetriphosphatase [Fonticula alba]|uniref:RNA helicase n=1 Tax=Fonticula alba TaxID=691883 RepID=A0A058ZHV3_FONAL|nr:adenosinetriphosphatase [Fonticula alba]KCV73087.1 adenosinetriphosphatase [Fonticula alba]|eukprot:XP_009492788.1 adenosinetriphosphatase [Fonticula alba]
MSQPRKRHNVKGRQHKRGDVHGVVVTASGAKVTIDSNAAVLDANLINTSVKQEQQKKNAQNDLPPEKRMTSTQKKRMEKYVQAQLKKEERGRLLEKLSASATQGSAGVTLQETKHLSRMLKPKVDKKRAFGEIDSASESEDEPEDDMPALPTVHLETVSAPREVADFAMTPAAPAAGARPVNVARIASAQPAPARRSEPATAAEPTPAPAPATAPAPVPAAGVPATDAPMDTDAPVVAAPRLISSTKTHRNSSGKAFYVTVNRKAEIQEARMRLPVCHEEQPIMESIMENDIVVISGETGSGKTTQVPQFLYEAGFGHPDSDRPGRIAITEPRRVAAVSMAKRVAEEMSLSDKKVSYQIRYEGTVSDETSILFMTDGVLLKQISTDFLLTGYSAIIIDEAHERNLNTDILIGLLSRIVPLRRKMMEEQRQMGLKKTIMPLKVIIMSATMRVADFTENTQLFKTPPPVINVDARQFPVTVHFNRRTPLDGHVDAAFKKICKINRRLPPGGILVFLTGQDEITDLCKKLRKKFPEKALTSDAEESTTSANAQAADQGQASSDVFDEIELNPNFADDRDDFDDANDDTAFDSADDSEESGDEDDELLEEVITPDGKATPLHVLPLYSILAPEKQMLVFEEPPAGTRLCVVATNVAETSITIPGIKYVVDCGKAKQRNYDMNTGIQTFNVSWISKASADQRSGRAGRTGPGHCYRLFSSAVFDNHFPQFSDPEIVGMPIENVVLQMKSMNIDNIVNFPFPTPPARRAIEKAEELLVYLGALEATSKKIIQAGKVIASFPISPRFAKMLILSKQRNCLPYAIAIVAALTVGDPFIQETFIEGDGNDELDAMVQEASSTGEEVNPQLLKQIAQAQKKNRRVQYLQAQAKFTSGTLRSDALKYLRAIIAYDEAADPDAFCEQYLLRPKAMNEIRKLRRQLTNLVNSVDSHAGATMPLTMPLPSPEQEQLLCQALFCGFVDQVATLSDAAAAAAVAGPNGLPRGTGTASRPYQTMFQEELTYIHPTSCVARRAGGPAPAFLVFLDLVRTTKRVQMKTCTEVRPTWLARLGAGLCQYSDPLENPPARYVPERDTLVAFCEGLYGPRRWILPVVEIPHPAGLDRMKLFARHLLEGDVAFGLREHATADRLITKPLVIQKPWTHARSVDFVQALVREKVDSKQALRRIWLRQPKFLLKEYLLWVKPEFHTAVSATWPPALDPPVAPSASDVAMRI